MATVKGMGTFNITAGTFEVTLDVPDNPNPPDPSPPDPEPPNGDGFKLGDVPFSPDSSWNSKVPQNASYKNLAWPASTGYNYIAGWAPSGSEAYTPAVYVSAPDDPVVDIPHGDTWGYPAATEQVRIKSGVSGAPGTDGELLIIDGDIVHNFWQFVRTGENSATCASYARDNVKTGSAWGTKSPFKAAGITAVGGSMLAGLLVEEETKTGTIAHALQLVCDEVLIKPNATGEAINSDGWSDTGIVQEADRLAIPRNASKPSGLSPLGEASWIALREYGAFVVDKAGMCSKIRMQLNAYNASIADAYSKDLAKLIPLLKKVS
jgi:hypothetical protein